MIELTRINRRFQPPAGLDLTAPLGKIATLCSVSSHTVRRWKREAGITIPPPGGDRTEPFPRGSKWRQVTAAEWAKGYRHVGRLTGEKTKVAKRAHEKLLKEKSA